MRMQARMVHVLRRTFQLKGFTVTIEAGVVVDSDCPCYAVGARVASRMPSKFGWTEVSRQRVARRHVCPNLRALGLA